MDANEKHEESELNPISEVIAGIELVSNRTDQKRKRTIKKLKDVIHDLEAVLRQRRARAKKNQAKATKK